MPAYNAGKYIAQTIEAFIAQTYTNWELIVVNDGSTDNTSEILSEFNDSRIKIIDSKNRGAAAARNLAFRNATGAFIVFFDADDIVSANYLQSQLRGLSGNPNAIVMADWQRFYERGQADHSARQVPYTEMSADQWIAEYWYNCNPMTNPGRTMIPRSVIDEAGVWDESLSLNDDLEFFTRIMFAANKILFNHNTSLAYRSGVGGLSALNTNEAAVSLFNAIALSVKLALSRYSDQLIIKQACANMWQSFIYINYPLHNNLVNKALQQLKALPKPTYTFPSGGVTKVLTALMGWRLTKQIKQLWS